MPLTRRERVGAGLSVAGLALLGLSLLGEHGEGSTPAYWSVGLWLAASAVAAVLSMWLVGGAPGWGIAAGVLFAGGDVSTKMAVSGGLADAAFFVSLIAFYGAGTAVLQAGFQRGGALTTAGLATLLTNALPIAAGMIVFAEPLPGGWTGAVRVLAFATVVAGAVLLSVRAKSAEDGDAVEVSPRLPGAVAS